MKLTKNSLISLIDKDKYGELYIKETKMYWEKMYNTELPVSNSEEIIEFLNEKGYRKLVFSEKSKQLLSDYIIPKEIRMDVLRSIPNRKDLIQVDDDTCIKYKKTDSYLSFVIYELDRKHGIVIHHHFDADLIKGEVKNIMEKTYFTNRDIKPLLEDRYQKFMEVVTFLELTPITLIVVNGGEKKGDVMRGNVLKNETHSSVIQVNTNWNYKMIRVGSFKVRGHFRWQACGKGLSQVKLIYIDMFEKGLMKRLSQKELQN